MNVSGSTRIYGLLGWPVSHSFSPGMQNAAFTACGLDCIYVPMPVQPGNLAAAISGIRGLSVSGANVTIPYKTAVMKFLDDLAPSALEIGSVNTIVNREGCLIGHNTDAGGFLRSLERSLAAAPDRAVILGAGGAALAVGHALFQFGVKQLTLAVRHPDKAAETAAALAASGSVQLCRWDTDCYQDVLAAAHIIVNATPLGMHPNTEDCPPMPWQAMPQSTAIVDLVYNPPVTKLLREAKRRGHPTVTGSGMLVEQGALAFELWTNLPAPRAVMTSYVKNRLIIDKFY